MIRKVLITLVQDNIAFTGMRDHTCLEIVADDTKRNSAEILKHMNIAAQPCLFVHVQARFHIRKLTVWKRRYKQIDGIYFILVRFMELHGFSAPVYFTYNAGLVHDVVCEIVLLNVLGIIFTKLCVSDRNTDFHTIFVILPQKLKCDTCLFQFTVNILIVNRSVHRFFLKPVRKEKQIDLVVTLVCQIRIADTQFSRAAAYSCNRLGGDVPSFNDLTL